MLASLLINIIIQCLNHYAQCNYMIVLGVYGNLKKAVNGNYHEHTYEQTDLGMIL